MAIKSILGGKSKNLFDISKVVQSAKLKNNGDGTLTVSDYGVSAGILKDLCPNIKVGDTIKAYYTPISWTAPNPPSIMTISGHILDRHANPSFVVTEVDLNGKVYFYNNNYTELNLPGTTVIGNIFITNDTTVTAANYKDRYVPYEITSYKSIMKVSDNLFITSFDERMLCKTKNLFSSSTEVGVPSSTKFDKSEKRLLEDGKWYIGLIRNNYYNPSAVPEYKIGSNYVNVVSRGSYGVAKCIYVEPNTIYTVTLKSKLVYGKGSEIGVGFYQADGTQISFTIGTSTLIHKFTTPENCKFITIAFCSTNDGQSIFSDIQLVKGTTATDYVPYGYV